VQVEAGSTVAIVGPSGSGKSTTLKLLTRLFDAEAGSVLINGVDVTDMSIKEVHTHSLCHPASAQRISILIPVSCCDCIVGVRCVGKWV
jgi:ABC-type multidrug transport system fused ATPase/permease subunit